MGRGVVGVAIGLFAVVGRGVGELIKLELGDCVRTRSETASCSSVDNATAALKCLQKAPPILVKSPEEHCFAIATETFKPTTSCIASNGTFGGWGLRLRSDVAVIPASVESLEVTTTVYSTTDPEHIFQESTLPVTVALIPDLEPNQNKTIIRRCAIEGAEGPVAALNVVDRRVQAGEVDATVTIDPPTVLSTYPMAVPRGKLLLEIVAHNVTQLTNGGPIPPALMKTLVTLRHRLRLSQLIE